jgi:predicted transcriptional regulator
MHPQRPDRGDRDGQAVTPEERRERRGQLGVSVHDLAREAGFVERTIFRFEAGLPGRGR